MSIQSILEKAIFSFEGNLNGVTERINENCFKQSGSDPNNFTECARRDSKSIKHLFNRHMLGLQFVQHSFANCLENKEGNDVCFNRANEQIESFQSQINNEMKKI